MILEHMTFYIFLIVFLCTAWSIVCSQCDISIGTQLFGHVVIFTVISWLFEPLIADAIATWRDICRPI